MRTNRDIAGHSSQLIECLADTGLVTRTPRYGGIGGPETEYRWR